MKKLQKSLILLMVVMSLFAFSSCNKGNGETAVSIGNVNVGQDVYAYYLDTVLQNSDENLKQDDAKKKAENLCVDYVRVNSEFKKLKLSLSSSAKAEVAINVNDLYSMYGGYYEKIGVTKQTLTNVMLSKAYKDELVTAIFGEGGEKAVSADAQKAYYNENYVFFKAISSYLYTTDADGKPVKISAEELEAVESKFSGMQSQITADNTIDAVNLAYETANGGTTESEMAVLSAQKGTDSYPENFFADVVALSNNEVKVLEYDNYIFLVQKMDSSTYYADNAKSCLTAMVSDDFSKELASRYSDMKISSESGVQSSTYKTIQRIKGVKE